MNRKIIIVSTSFKIIIMRMNSLCKIIVMNNLINQILEMVNMNNLIINIEISLIMIKEIITSPDKLIIPKEMNFTKMINFTAIIIQLIFKIFNLNISLLQIPNQSTTLVECSPKICCTPILIKINVSTSLIDLPKFQSIIMKTIK